MVVEDKATRRYDRGFRWDLLAPPSWISGEFAVSEFQPMATQYSCAPSFMILFFLPSSIHLLPSIFCLQRTLYILSSREILSYHHFFDHRYLSVSEVWYGCKRAASQLSEHEDGVSIRGIFIWRSKHTSGATRATAPNDKHADERPEQVPIPRRSSRRGDFFDVSLRLL